MKTIKELFNIPFVEFKSSPTVPNLNPPDPSLAYGIELEIEYARPEWAGEGKYWYVETDGSLRNNGFEFISPPSTYNVLAFYLKEFFIKAINSKFFDEKRYPHYTERTSIHLHTNCLDLSVEQVTNILMLYQTVEDLLYAFVGHNRRENIFCVPWSETQLTYNALDDLTSFVKQSSIERNKYTGLNVVPLKTAGTLEWRHLYGTSDLNVILKWMTLIGHFYRVVKNHSTKEIKEALIDLNTTSYYENLIDWMFMQDGEVLKVPGYQKLLEDGILNMKYSIIQSSMVKSKKTKPIGIDVFEYVVDVGRAINHGRVQIEPPSPAAEFKRHASSINYNDVLYQRTEFRGSSICLADIRYNEDDGEFFVMTTAHNQQWLTNCLGFPARLDEAYVFSENEFNTLIDGGVI